MFKLPETHTICCLTHPTVAPTCEGNLDYFLVVWDRCGYILLIHRLALHLVHDSYVALGNLRSLVYDLLDPFAKTYIRAKIKVN